MKLIVEFLIIFKMNFCLKRCISLIKVRKAVLGNSDFSWYTRRQTQQGPLSLAIYLPLSEQFWDEDKQWKGRWQKRSHQQGRAEQRHTPHQGHTKPSEPWTSPQMDVTSTLHDQRWDSAVLEAHTNSWAGRCGTTAWKTSCKLPPHCSSCFQLPNPTESFTRRYFPMLSLSETNFLIA